jgi:hypothetical protein
MDIQHLPFHPFGKVPRLLSDIVVTEKIDGTNGAIVVSEDGKVYAQSRNRVISPDDDNYGFAKWVERNAASFRINPQIMEDAGGAEDIQHVTYFGE